MTQAKPESWYRFSKTDIENFIANEEYEIAIGICKGILVKNKAAPKRELSVMGEAQEFDPYFGYPLIEQSRCRIEDLLAAARIGNHTFIDADDLAERFNGSDGAVNASCTFCDILFKSPERKMEARERQTAVPRRSRPADCGAHLKWSAQSSVRRAFLDFAQETVPTIFCQPP